MNSALLELILDRIHWIRIFPTDHLLQTQDKWIKRIMALWKSPDFSMIQIGAVFAGADSSMIQIADFSLIRA